MSAKKTTITVLAALLGLSWMAAPSATAQLMEPATGWVPGQPYVITVSDPDLVAVAVVYVGRIPPLSTGERVRLFLPNLDRSGLVYAVSTLDDNEVRRPGDAPRRVARKPREVAGRVHSVVIPSPANPALGQASTTVLVIDARGISSHLEGGGPGGWTSSSQPGGVVDVQDGLLDVQPWSGRRTLDGGRPRGEGVVATPDPHGAARRMLRPPEPGAMRRLADGVATLGTARDVLGGTGDRATTYDTGGPGVQEATAGGDPCFKGPWQSPGSASLTSVDDVLGIAPAATRRTLDGGRPAGDRVAPRDRGGVPRPVEDVPFVGKRGVPDTGGGVLGYGRFPWYPGDQGLTLEGTMR